jgi:hypothetical protein
MKPHLTCYINFIGIYRLDWFFCYLLTGALLGGESKNSTVSGLQLRQEEGAVLIDHCPEKDNANKGDLVQNGFCSCPDPHVKKVSGRHLHKYAHAILYTKYQSMHAST